MVPILLLNEKRPGKPQGTHSTHTTYYVKHRSTHLDVVCCGIPNNTHSLSMYDSTCTTYYSYIPLSAQKKYVLYTYLFLYEYFCIKITFFMKTDKNWQGMGLDIHVHIHIPCGILQFIHSIQPLPAGKISRIPWGISGDFGCWRRESAWKFGL